MSSAAPLVDEETTDPSASPSRRKLKNEDSSYDSDFDSKADEDDLKHDYVSRTVSDTLGAEFAEYVTLEKNTINAAHDAATKEEKKVALESKGSSEEPKVIRPTAEAKVNQDRASLEHKSQSWGSGSSSYAQQVEFGVKLGYSEALVQRALQKLGEAPGKDEFLGELIRLGAGVPTTADLDGSKDSEEAPVVPPSPLRTIIIDGSNVAMSHGRKLTFSCKGLQLCVDWFKARGHKEVLVFVPSWRKETPRWDTPIKDQETLQELERDGFLVFTPSRTCSGKRIVPYDDRFILNEAIRLNGVVVSNDNYRDLAVESPQFRRFIEDNILMYSWVNGRFVVPDDPLGRNGPTLDVFLRKPSGLGSRELKQSPCPYGQRCTYGNKCKYMHPERGSAPLKSVTERLQEQAQKHFQHKAKSRESSPGENLRAKSLSLPVSSSEKKPLIRTQSISPTVSQPSASNLVSEQLAVTAAVTTAPSAANLAPSSLHSHHIAPLHYDIHQEKDSCSMDPLLSQSLFKSESSLLPLFQTPPPSSLSNYWKSQDIDIPTIQFGSHLSLSNQLSESDTSLSANPHRKLQRQLTLNPDFDSRLYKIGNTNHPDLYQVASTMSQSVARSSTSSQVKTADVDLGISPSMTQSSSLFGSCFSASDQLQFPLHQSLTRHASTEGAKSPSLGTHPSHLFPSYTHPNVTRFASAPDQIWGGTPQLGNARIARLNSTSDTRLNMYGSHSDSTSFLNDPFEEPSQLQPFSHQGPLASRPLSPQHTTGHHHSQHIAHQTPTQFPFTSLCSAAIEDTRLQQYYYLAQVKAAMAEDSDKVRASVTPPPGPVGTRSVSPMDTFRASPASARHEDARFLAFHVLCQHFPISDVRSLMARYPDETDPQKLCSLLTAMPSGGHI